MKLSLTIPLCCTLLCCNSKTETIVTYVPDTEEKTELSKPVVTATSKKKPSSPSSASAPVITSIAPTPIPIPEEPKVIDPTHPDKIQKLLKLISKTKPNTSRLDFYDQLDALGFNLNDNKNLLSGAYIKGESVEQWDLKVQGQYILTIEFTGFKPYFMRKIKVIKHSVKHFITVPYEDTWKGATTVFPHYLKGQIMWKELKPKK